MNLLSLFTCRHLFSKCLPRFCTGIHQRFGENKVFFCLVLYFFWKLHAFTDLYNVSFRPRAILDIIRSGESFRIANSTKMPEQGTCERCGYISSQVKCASSLWSKTSIAYTFSSSTSLTSGPKIVLGLKQTHFCLRSLYCSWFASLCWFMFELEHYFLEIRVVSMRDWCILVLVYQILKKILLNVES